MPVTCREYQKSDSEAVRKLLNSVFPRAPLGKETWKKITAKNFTAPVAEADGKIVGAIPLKMLDFTVAPGHTIRAWIEFRVGVSADFRGMGIGNKLQDCLKNLLKGRGEMLMIRSARENSGPYQFYSKNGFYDISMPVRYRIENDRQTTITPEVKELSADEFFALENDWNRIFTDCYGDFGGYTKRENNFRRDILELRALFAESHRFFALKEEGKYSGFLILETGENSGNILECAAAGALQNRLKKLFYAALSAGLPLVFHVNAESPLKKLLDAENIQPEPRESGSGNPVTAFVLDLENTGKRIINPLPGQENLDVKIWTPESDGFIHRGKSAKETVTLEMKQHTLVKLLTRRIDLPTAITEERITVSGANPETVQLLAEAFKPAPWCYFEIDGL